MSKFKEMVLNLILGIIQSFDGNVNKAVTVLSQDIFSGAMYNFAKTVSALIEPIALTIITICFLIEFLKLTIKMDILKWEYGLRVFFKFVFAKVCIDMSYTLLSAIYATGAEWVTQVGTTGSTLGNTVSVYLENQFSSLGFWEVLGLVVSMIVVFIAINIIGYLVVVIAYARMFELLIYLAVSPLPCAFLPVEDGAGSRIPKKFFLSFAGVCLQGLFIIISIKLYATLCNDVIITNLASGNISDLAYNMLLGALVLIMAVVKSGSWAKSILDAM